jgi:hypothetical protein
MASGNTLCAFSPFDNVPPTSNNASFSVRNGHPVLAFDTTTAEDAIFTGLMPRHYAAGGVTVYLHWAAASATSGTIGWTVAFERFSDATLDIDADSFATAQTITAATVPGTSGVVTVGSVGFTNGSQMDSVAVGEGFRLKVTRDVANDTATGDAQLLLVEIKET